MTDFKKCLFLTLVSCVVSFPYPISQPVYPNTQLLSAETVPQTSSYKQPAAPGYIPQTQYIRQPVAQPVYDIRAREGLQNYATNNQNHATTNQNYATNNNQNQAIQQLLVPAAVERQVPKVALPSAQYYLNQIQSAHLAAQAQDAFSASQRKASPPVVNRPVTVPQHSPLPLPQQYSRDQPLQYNREQSQQYAREQPVQYVREQPQTRYISRPVTAQYRVQQQQPQEEQQKEKEDYDHNPSYQFGFDVKDDLYTNYQNRKEQREGNKITGSYSVVDSDGFIRTVSYTADPKEGFKAEVTRQPTDIVVKVPKPAPQFQNVPRQQQYIQEVPSRGHVQQEQRQQSNVVYQYQ